MELSSQKGGKRCPSDFKMLISCKDDFVIPGNGLEKQESVDVKSGELMRQKKTGSLNELQPQREDVGHSPRMEVAENNDLSPATKFNFRTSETMMSNRQC